MSRTYKSLKSTWGKESKTKSYLNQSELKAKRKMERQNRKKGRASNI